MKIICYALSAFIFLGYVSANAMEKTEISFALIGTADSSAYNGVVQGIHEANLQGQFLGQNYSLYEFSGDNMDAIDPTMFIAIIVATNADNLQQAARRFKDHAILNIAVHDDALREACSPNLLHIIPSSRMLADAKTQWLQKSPDDEINVSGWHPDFVKFAARDLNKRFKKKFSKPMDQYAWAGWSAVRMTSDSVARNNLTDPSGLLNYLKTGLSFDGQKGLAMDFRNTGQLRQLLLIVNPAGELIGEAPVRGVVAPDAVDSLGLTSCSNG